MGRTETRMQGRALDVYRRGEITQADAAELLGISRAALAMRLHRHRKRNHLARRRPRPKHRRPARFLQLSTVDC